MLSSQLVHCCRKFLHWIFLKLVQFNYILASVVKLVFLIIQKDFHIREIQSEILRR